LHRPPQIKGRNSRVEIEIAKGIAEEIAGKIEEK
jgi:hypothetical protein